ncbi:MAG TPA: phosphatase PAP2 family protein [Gemmatimonadaceae bacterium]|nr:phosphatase PAP2 family protein [Gemmatimonadaceae bacterium]
MARVDTAVRAVVRDSSVQAVPVLRTVAEAANWWGGPGVIWFGAVAWLGARALRRRAVARIGLRGIEALAVASALSGIVKGLAGRARPFVGGGPWRWEFNHGWTDARFFSMPSGHTTATMAFATGVLFATAGWPAGRRAAVAAPVVASALVVAWARVFTDQHWFSDVLTALLLGAATSVILARLHAGREASAYNRWLVGPVSAVNDPGAAHTPEHRA